MVAGADLIGVMDVNLEVAENAALGSAYATQDLDKLLNDSHIDAVLIASLTSLQAGSSSICRRLA